MTIAKSVRMKVGLLDSARKASKFYNVPLNQILNDCILRGLLTYSLVPYFRMKTTRDRRLVEKRLDAIGMFLEKDLRRLSNTVIDDTTAKERSNGIV